MTVFVARKRLLGFALSLVVAAQVFAQSTLPGATKHVDIYLKDADLLQATQMLTKQTGLQFIIAPSKDEFDKINLSLTDITAEQAIKYICAAAGAHAERDENGVFIIRRGREAEPQPGRNNSAVNDVKKPLKIERIKIMHADAAVVYEQIFTNVVFDPESGLRKMKGITHEFNGLDQAQGTSVILTGGGETATIGATNNNPNSSGARVNSAPEAGNDVQLPGESANQRGPGGGGGGFGSGGGGFGNGGGGNGNGNGGGQGATAPQGGTGFTPDGITKVTYDPITNSLIVEGDDEAIRKLRSIVNLFDQVPKQVVVKVEFITTSQGLQKDFGMDWLYQRGAINAGNRPGSFAKSGDPIFINYATGNITTRLRTSLLESGGKSVQAPLVRTLNNQPAIVNQSLQTYFFTPIVQNGNGGITTTYQPVALNVNTQLAVRPRINEDGYITMTLAPALQDIGGVKVSPDGVNSIPEINSQSIFLTARVKSGETIALGGLTRKSTTNQVQKFPVLGDLPIIGSLFRTSSYTRSDSELIIFVTPYIVDEEAGGLTP